MNIEKLVPSLELCKQIPVGEFEDTCFFWFNFGNGYTVCKNGKSGFADLQNAYPAPTLQEVMAKLPYTVRTDFILEQFHIYNDIKNGYGVSNASPPTAALKLWLKLNKK